MQVPDIQLVSPRRILIDSNDNVVILSVAGITKGKRSHPVQCLDMCLLADGRVIAQEANSDLVVLDEQLCVTKRLKGIDQFKYCNILLKSPRT